MDDLTRFWTDLAGRMTGPLTFRLILQPIMATLYALHDGVKDAREGRPAYLWSILTDPLHRVDFLVQGARAVLRVILLGIAMDVAYQIIVFRWIYTGELIVVVLLLTFMPYLLVRGPANRIARAWMGREKVRP